MLSKIILQQKRHGSPCLLKLTSAAIIVIALAARITAIISSTQEISVTAKTQNKNYDYQNPNPAATTIVTVISASEQTHIYSSFQLYNIHYAKSEVL